MAKRVLVAEDEPNIAESLRFLLSRAGFEVCIHERGTNALAAALETCPDVLVLDAMLPEMDGYEILRRIRRDPRGQAIPILMLTAKGQRADREKAVESGADVFMTKPFSNADLMDAVARLADGRSA